MPDTLQRTTKLQTWESTKKARYLKQQPRLKFHFVLDASPSMLGQRAADLRRSFNTYLEWLQHQADARALAEIRCFSDYLEPSCLVPLRTLTPLTALSYNPGQGNGTALYRAIGETCLAVDAPGQHILIVFSDGLDNRSSAYGWTRPETRNALAGAVAHCAVLAVFLGALVRGKALGQALGFAEGNCLPLTTDQIPEAFAMLTVATARYLSAGPNQRKLLAQTGVF